MEKKRRTTKDLVDSALSGSKSAYRQLRSEMAHLASLIAAKYAKRYQAAERTLVRVGMTYFDFALKKYGKHLLEARGKKRKLYKFSTYFAWWALTSVKTYLGIAKEPLKRIKPR